MKTILILILLMPICALANECFDKSDADMMMRVIVDSSGNPTQVSLVNLDYSMAGVGDLQDLQSNGRDLYTIVSESKALVGFSVGTRFGLERLGDGHIQSIYVYQASGNPGDLFACD